MAGPRSELAAALDAAAPAIVAVWAAPVRESALPAIVIRPGRPYQRSPDAPAPPGCTTTWRLIASVCVAREATDALEQTDALLDVIRTALRTTGTTYRWISTDPAMAPDDLGGVEMYRSDVNLEVST